MIPKNQEDYHFSVRDDDLEEDSDEDSTPHDIRDDWPTTDGDVRPKHQYLSEESATRKKKKKKKKVMAKQTMPQNKCTLAIDRLNREQTINFSKLSLKYSNGTVRPYTDPDFKPDGNAIIWTDYASPKILGELGRYQRVAWKRISNIIKDKKCLNYFFGYQGINPFDI